MDSMRIPVWLGVLAAAFFLCISPVVGFFEAFGQLAEQLKAIEQSAPGDLDTVLRKQETETAVRFNDVASDHWFYRYVSPVARWGIVSGYKNADGKSTGVFGPGNTVTVAEILKMALKAAQVDETACTGKTGMPQAETHWAKAFVVCAREKRMRILRLDPDLNRPATRAEVLSVIFDAFGDDVPPLFSPFKDTAGHPLESTIAYGAALRMVSGDKDDSGQSKKSFRPDAAVNRAEASKILYERLRVEVMGDPEK